MEISQRLLSLMYKQLGIQLTGIEIQNTESVFEVKCFNGYAVAKDVETNVFYLLEYPTLEELDQRQLNEVYYYCTGNDDEDITIDLIDVNDVMMAYGEIVK